MDKNELYVIYGKQYKKMTRELLERAGLAAMIGDRKRLVGIKPNLLGPVPAEQGATTHPCVIEALLEYLQENGFRNLVILEGSWVGDTTRDSLLVCGYDKICEKYHVPFWDMQEDMGRKTDCAGMELNICQRVAQIGFLINVPVLKGHCQTCITCALKNMKGLIPNSEKRRFHRLGLHRPIGHLAAGIHQDFILVDSICGDLTFEDGGNPVEQDRLIAAADPVLCDTFGCSLLDIPVESVPYIGIARELGIGSTDLQQAQILELIEKQDGDQIAYTSHKGISSGQPEKYEWDMEKTQERKETEWDMKKPHERKEAEGGMKKPHERKEAEGGMKKLHERKEAEWDMEKPHSGEEIKWNLEKPRRSENAEWNPDRKNTNNKKEERKKTGAGGYRKVMRLAAKAEEVDSCSACYASLIPALQRLDQEGLLEHLTEKVCIGQGYRGKSGELGVGNCTCHFAHTVAGCPPTEHQMYDFLKKYIFNN